MNLAAVGRRRGALVHAVIPDHARHPQPVIAEYTLAPGVLRAAMLFAFSTAISWSYYGDRAVTYLWGIDYVRYYRVLYVLGFFAAALIDTTIIWTFSGIAIALMTLPNIIAGYWETMDFSGPDNESKNL